MMYSHTKNVSNPKYFSKTLLLLRHCLRVAMASAMHYSGLTTLSDSRTKARILMYHDIDNNPSDVHSVSPMAFEKQMHFLATRYNVISLDQLVSYLNNQDSLPDNLVVITFDDGLASHYSVAYPILQRYNLPATIFLVPSWIASEENSLTGRAHSSETNYVTWDQVREMSRNGISIGAHTMSHRSLPTLTLKEVRYELLESKARLEQRLDQPVRFFAYPYGAFRDISRDILHLVAESGYVCAVTSLSGTNGPSTNPYLLKRTEVEVHDGMYVFSKALAGALDNWIVLQRLLWVSQKLAGS